MALDNYNTLDKFPLPGLDEFIKKCNEMEISEINMTGTNTDPLLYKHTQDLKLYLLKYIPKLSFKIRTNAVKNDLSSFNFYNGGSITICSLNENIYKQMMGKGTPPDIEKILKATNHWRELKINIVLGDENVKGGDIHETLAILESYKIQKVNLREPYGQAHIGNPLATLVKMGEIFGNPYYDYENGMRVTYWDVHYTEVESINLYANGIVSTTYPITKGHDPVTGKVLDQSHFGKGRHYKQWTS